MTTKKYAFREQFTDVNGIRHNIRANTHKELLDKIAKVKKEIEEGYTPLKANSLTVKKWFSKCISEYKPDIAPETLTGYKSKVNRWIYPEIGNLKLKDIKPLHCQEILNNMTGKATDTIRKVKQLLFFCFDKAVENRLIRENPAEHLTIPKGHKSSHRAITEHERYIILKTVENALDGKTAITDGRYRNIDISHRYVYFLFMLFCGCRPSEVANIQAFDIQTINGKHLLHIRGTKTKNADRKVPIPDYLYNRIPETDSPFNYLFTNLKGGKLSAENRQSLWKAFKRDLNITAGCKIYRNELIPPYPISKDLEPYCLRHTYCTDLMKYGIDIRQAQYLMGHADIKLTANIYTHQSEDSLLEIADILNRPEEALTADQDPEEALNKQPIKIVI